MLGHSTSMWGMNLHMENTRLIGYAINAEHSPPLTTLNSPLPNTPTGLTNHWDQTTSSTHGRNWYHVSVWRRYDSSTVSVRMWTAFRPRVYTSGTNESGQAASCLGYNCDNSSVQSQACLILSPPTLWQAKPVAVYVNPWVLLGVARGFGFYPQFKLWRCSIGGCILIFYC